MSATVIFGYRHVNGVPTCPCQDPGNYMMMEQPDPERPLKVRFRCWCGATIDCTFDTDEERAAFLRSNGIGVPGG